MTLADIIADSANVSAIIEVFTLFFIVAGFFRWYDSKYQKTIVSTKDEVISKIQNTHATISERLARMDAELMRLDERFHKHVTDDNVHNHHPTKRI